VRSIDSRFLARIEYFSNLLHSIFDNSFKFIDVIEVFTTYDKFNSADLRLNNSKKAIKNIISTKKLKQEFIKEAFVIAPNSESSESIELLTGVLNNLDLYEWIFPNKQPGPNSDFNNPIYGGLETRCEFTLCWNYKSPKRVFFYFKFRTKRTNYEGNIRKGMERTQNFYGLAILKT